MFTPLDFPPAKLRLTRSGTTVHVFCVVRKKQLVLTPEEWVRQHLIHFLIDHLNVPIGLISSEMSLNINGLVRRCDVVVFNRFGKPVFLMECKATDVVLGEEVVHQIAQYNFSLGTDYLLVTNGKQHRILNLDREKGEIKPLEEFPDFSVLIGD
jgi:predicted type IV restriction endonuclease